MLFVVYDYKQLVY